MADQQQEQRQIQFRIDETKMATVYANTIRTTSSQDEMILDFGLNIPMPTQDGQGMLVFNVGSRVVMNWQAAKRLAISMAQAVRQYEEANGEIKLPGQQQPPRAGGSPRLAD